ncbi:MAG: adenosylcobinamide-phosphate synthase CbiB [Hoeflea sp.]|uniref:adenosylcobinamide-phosphate synthase CbiB n=1 Tax=Hoeflea sp. TaxID=1940281 RepID=UPI0032EE2446
MTAHLLMLFAALVLDRLAGDPDWLWRRAMHPVVIFGNLVGLADRHFNKADESAAKRRQRGVATILALLGLAVVTGLVMDLISGALGPLGIVFEVVIVAVFLAQKSLADHVCAVVTGFRERGLDGGRKAVSMIVGRDPETLDEAGVSRAAIESLAENFSDGVVAPVFWYAIFGLPGLMAYKMLNTADSMIGHLNDRHRDFGWAAARLDDAANWPAARLSAILITGGAGLAIGGNAVKRATATALSDSGLHRSPNAGWPEAAMAGALNLALAGPRSYGGELVMEASLNAGGRREVRVADIESALIVFSRSCDCLALVALLLAISL